MTTTNFNIGLMNDNRNSSRVLKPPGGGHTDLFGPPEPITPKVNAKQSQISQIFGNDDQNSNCSTKKKNLLKSSIVFSEEENENKNQTNNTVQTEQNEQKTEETKTEDNVDNNKQTEEAKEVQKEVQKPKRVPPGGYSTSLW
ncbi:jupiter microtubule associated homolog 1-like [Chrysoperla carnea]|uniref:jupiter microtubule associated homolog 1-like n=1 Tax=Chrysoperla carnea TaxID=189513 RepID=UPI001D09305D|nr:jupiter microtubule associated homolog 1-like [Chrysoperla carnea]